MNKLKYKIAVIGTSEGQKGLLIAAERKGIEAIAFSVPGKNDYSHLAKKHYNISVDDVDNIVEICKAEGVCGVVSNGSDFTAKYANEISYKLGLPCNDPIAYRKASDKYYVREKTQKIEELAKINHYLYREGFIPKFPCIVKPQISGGKNGLSIAYDMESFNKAINYARNNSDCEILIEDYITGLELSVEVLSFNGSHRVIQTCEAETSGQPHFVEVAHHLPANISNVTLKKIERIVPNILDAINFKNGATDIEMMVDDKDNIYLIEVNLRGAGGNITNDLVPLSTGYDYLGGLIDISMGKFEPPKKLDNNFVGDYYLCKQTLDLMPLFDIKNNHTWLVNTTIDLLKLNNIPDVKMNCDREGYIIYKSDHRIGIKDCNV